MIHEWGDQYVNAEILILRGDRITRCQVVCQKHDSDGNLISGSDQNPKLDKSLFEIEFAAGEMTELGANIIAESIHAQCDVDGNVYLSLDAFVNHNESGSALTVKDKKLVIRDKKTLESQQLIGTFTANGKSNPHHGRILQY